jgi:hypothetical protein
MQEVFVLGSAGGERLVRKGSCQLNSTSASSNPSSGHMCDKRYRVHVTRAGEETIASTDDLTYLTDH